MNRPGADAAPGAIGLASPLVCAAAGYEIGSLLDPAVPLGPVGPLAGIGGGMALVYARSRRI